MSAPTADLFQARLHIERLVCAYAEALDAGDVARVAALFDRGQIRINGMSVVHKGSDAVRDMFVRFTVFYDKSMQPANPLLTKARPWTKHLSTNLRFESLAENEAVLWSDFTVLQGLPGSELKPIVAGRYRDTFSRAEEGWYFADRLEFIDLIGDVSKHLQGNPLA
ncbi:MAG TPA: nuclear transport factor 2 family protein [Pseudomonadales bacterium]|nr:nuclear transport factor 2 family protein [Pseudomonadales bacterium]